MAAVWVGIAHAVLVLVDSLPGKAAWQTDLLRLKSGGIERMTVPYTLPTPSCL